MAIRLSLVWRTLAGAGLLLATAGCSEAPSAPAARAARIGARFDEITPFYDTRLSDADAAVEKAIVLIQAAQNPGAKNPDKPFGGHDTKAISYLQKAREEIAAAEAYADQTP